METLLLRPKRVGWLLTSASLAWLGGCGGLNEDLASLVPPAGPAPDAAEQVVGERLFLETRFAQFFAAHVSSDVNAPLAAGDPTVDATQTTGAPLPGPFAGRSMNCGSCHLVDQQDGVAGGGTRTYADFARRSPIPERADGRRLAARNSPSLVDSFRPHAVAPFLHLDGEFTNNVDLVKGTLTGRNYGWLAHEHAEAVAHVARIVREDDGTDALAADTAHLPYRVLLDPRGDVPAELVIPAELRVDVTTASDDEILLAVAKLVDAYLRGLQFQRDATGAHSGSPYDVFLVKNGLPRQPADGEGDRAYSRRLRDALDVLAEPRFVGAADGAFTHHAHEFRFDALELRGLRTFLSEGDAPFGTSVGNCTACHPAPRFSDGRFHAIGTAQEEYDSIHGTGAFANLFVPDLATRAADPDAWLPPSVAHPFAAGPFLAVPSAEDPVRTDLGLWNVFANPDLPGQQPTLRRLIVRELRVPEEHQNEADLLPLTLGMFKTPRLRDLADSAPYMHTGRFDALEDVLAHYRDFSALARAGHVRNAAPELLQIELDESDVASLAAFLRSLDEDYD